MKTPHKKSHDKMWHKIQNDLCDISADNFSQDIKEIKLLVAVLVLAGQDRDIEYIKCQRFSDLCYHVKLHRKFVIDAFKRAWRIEDNAVIWSETAELLEEDF